MKTIAEKINETLITVVDFPKQGVHFKDITPIFLDAKLCKEIIRSFTEVLENQVDMVCGIESRGFLFGPAIAQKLNLPFVWVRKAGKLPGNVLEQSYDLEYGQATLEIKKDFIKPNMRVLIHDDVLATGGTAEATTKIIEKCGAQVLVFAFLLSIPNLGGLQRLKMVAPHAQIISLTN